MADRLTAEEYLALQELFGHHVLMSAIRKIFKVEELGKLEAMRGEALGHGRASEIIKYAAESRVYAEWETHLKERMQRMAPQSS